MTWLIWAVLHLALASAVVVALVMTANVAYRMTRETMMIRAEKEAQFKQLWRCREGARVRREGHRRKVEDAYP